MADDNLFLVLKKYAPGPNIDPKENFLTEAFAWLLRQHEELAVDFIRFISREYGGDFPLPSDAPEHWLTQEGDGQVWLDMVADFGDKAIIFEHKVWSSLGENQIKRYRDYGGGVWSGGVLVVLITAKQSQHAQDPDVALTWVQVYRQIKTWLDHETENHKLVDHFLGLLRAEGLGPPAPISHESILAYLPAQSLEPSLTKLLERAMGEDWSWLDDKIHPTKRGAKFDRRWKNNKSYREGRLGLDLFDDWHPGFFVGVMINGSDHKVEPSKPHLGPDFCFILSYDNQDKGSPTWDEFIHGDEYSRLRTRLTNKSKGWDVLDHLKEHNNPNKWHPLHLRRPLLEVMRGTQTTDEQLAAFMKASQEVVELVLEDGEIREFWNKWADSSPESAASK